MLDLPPTYCEMKQQQAERIIIAVRAADLPAIKIANIRELELDRKIMRLALDYSQKSVSVSQFGLIIYKGCINE